MKPVELVQKAIENSSKTRDLVLDPFGGSGSTLIACEKANRRARLIELDPKYCDVIVKRWQEFTGKQAIHEEQGRAFADLEGERFIIRHPPLEQNKNPRSLHKEQYRGFQAEP